MAVTYVGNILKCFFFSSSRSDSDEDVSIIFYCFCLVTSVVVTYIMS